MRARLPRVVLLCVVQAGFSTWSANARAGGVLSFEDLAETTRVTVNGIANPNDYSVTQLAGEGWNITIKNALFAAAIPPGPVGTFLFVEPIFEDPRQPPSDLVQFDVINVNGAQFSDLSVTFFSDPLPANLGNVYGSAVETGLPFNVPLPAMLVPGPSGPYYPGGPVPDGITVFVTSDATPEPSSLIMATTACLIGLWRLRRRNSSAT